MIAVITIGVHRAVAAACAGLIVVAASALAAGDAVAKSAKSTSTAATPPDASGKAVDAEVVAKAQRCESLSTEIKKHIGMVKALEIRAEREKVGPPATLKRAWERMSGSQETGNTVTGDQLAAARNRVSMLSTGLVANSCPPIDAKSVKPADLPR